jgi:hypothetical protein
MSHPPRGSKLCLGIDGKAIRASRRREMPWRTGDLTEVAQ